MDAALQEFMAEFHWSLLLVVIAFCIYVLGKGADWLVAEAVVLSERSGMPKVVIGSTIVSLGTTTPEAAVSVFAALQNKPDMALGNAAGSIICDTGLVLGIACLIAPLPLHRGIVNRQGWVQVLAGLLLVLACWPLGNPLSAFTEGGRLPQAIGVIFVILLVAYLWTSVRWAKADREAVQLEDLEADAAKSTPLVVSKLLAGIALVVLASTVLIPAVTVLAERLSVPKGIITATLVAFGTSFPELVTAVTAARRGHGDLAVGNVIGADILNVLFVAGLSAAVTPAGLPAGAYFFKVIFPGMILLLAVFRAGIFVSGDRLRRSFGVVLLVVYGLVSFLSYLVR